MSALMQKEAHAQKRPQSMRPFRSPSGVNSMYGDRCVIVLTCQPERKLPVGDEGQLLALGIMDRIKLLKPVDLFLHIVRQVAHVHGLYVYDAILFRACFKWFLHLFTLS